MASSIEWINRPVREGSSEVSSVNVGQNFLYVGGMNLHFLWTIYGPYIKSDADKVAQIIVDYLIKGEFDVFCVHDITCGVLRAVRNMIRCLDSNWETSWNGDELLFSHVVIFKKTILSFVDKKVVSKLRDPNYLRFFPKEYVFRRSGLMFTKDVSCTAYVFVLKLISMKNSYVKILSVDNLPPLIYDEPAQDAKEKLSDYLELKIALYNLFRVPEATADSRCYYFVCGSVSATDTEGVDLLKSSVDEIITAGQLTMILPEDQNDDYDNPNITTVVIEKLQYFDPELLVPFNTKGMTSFLYHSKNAVTQAMCKKEMTDSASSISETSHCYPCGGKFLLLDHEDTKGVEAS